MQKNKALTALAIVVPVLVVIFAGALFTLSGRLAELREENAQLRESVERLEQENGFYKKAYELTLDDIKVLSRSYGGEERYERLANELREKELGTVLGEEVGEAYLLKNTRLWSEYKEKGVIRTHCLSAMDTDTVTQEVLVTARLNSSLEQNLSFYVDGNLLVTRPAGEVSFSVSLPDGPHELAIVSKEGSVTLESLHFDTIQLHNVVGDAGSGLAIFDCEDAFAGDFLDGPGAFRALIEKK